MSNRSYKLLILKLLEKLEDFRRTAEVLINTISYQLQMFPAKGVHFRFGIFQIFEWFE